eukprot:9474803-Pyramimonas_sp.AAC.1
MLLLSIDGYSAGSVPVRACGWEEGGYLQVILVDGHRDACSLLRLRRVVGLGEDRGICALASLGSRAPTAEHTDAAAAGPL